MSVQTVIISVCIYKADISTTKTNGDAGRVTSKNRFALEAFFDSSHLILFQIVDFLYFWSRKLLLKDISDEDNVTFHTAVEYSNIIRVICGLWCIDKQEQIGGEGKVVKIDESKWIQRKYYRGEWKEGIWVFGNISLQLILLLFLLSNNFEHIASIT